MTLTELYQLPVERAHCVNSDCYKAARTIKPEGIMLHSVGCPQPNPEAFYKYWNQPGISVCAHYVVGTERILCLLPPIHRAWHAGGSANNTHIGIEMTEPSTIKYTGGSTFVDLDPAKSQEHVRLTYINTIKLFSRLCYDYNINPLTGIISHAEGHKLGIASNHGDPEHLWMMYPQLGYTMDGFRNDVYNFITKEIDSPSKWATLECDWAVRLGIIQGKGERFGWQDTLTREEMAVILYRLYGHILDMRNEKV